MKGCVFMKTIKRSISLVLAAIFMFGCAVPSFAHSAENELIIQTEYGKIKGMFVTEVNATSEYPMQKQLRVTFASLRRLHRINGTEYSKQPFSLKSPFRLHITNQNKVRIPSG